MKAPQLRGESDLRFSPFTLTAWCRRNRVTHLPRKQFWIARHGVPGVSHSTGDFDNERRPIAGLGQLPEKLASIVPLLHVPLLVAIGPKSIPH